MTTSDKPIEQSPKPAAKASSSKPGNYVWAETEPGNFLALKHGIYSSRIVGDLAIEATAKLLQHRPDLEAFPIAVQAWSQAFAESQMWSVMLDVAGVIDGKTMEPRTHWLKELHAAQRREAEERRELGLSPLSYVRLQKEMADAAASRFDLNAVLADGRQARIAAEHRLGIELVSHDDDEPSA